MNENEMKSLERRLRCWQPRRPSATLKLRRFVSRVASVPRMVRFAGWLTPATACALGVLLVANSENAVPIGGSQRASIMAMVSNQAYAVFATSRQSEQNSLCAVTFDWTNGSHSGSNPPFMPFRKPTD